MDADSDDMTASTTTGNTGAGQQHRKMPISGDGKITGDQCRHAGFQFHPRLLQTSPRSGHPPQAVTDSKSDQTHSSNATPTHTPTRTPTGGKCQVNRTNAQPCASSNRMEGSLMESRVTCVEGDIRTLSSDVNNLRSDLGTVKHSVNRLESGQSQGKALMVRMLQGIAGRRTASAPICPNLEWHQRPRLYHLTRKTWMHHHKALSTQRERAQCLTLSLMHQGEDPKQLQTPTWTWTIRKPNHVTA